MSGSPEKNTTDQTKQIYEPLQRDVFRDGVIASIEKALFSRQLKPGDRVVETEIARQTGISRGPVREALQQLVGEGVLVNHPYHGTFVARWTARDVSEVYGLRAVLESYAVRLALERMTDGILAKLESIIEEMCELARRGDGEGVSELDIQFHEQINEFSDQRLLCRTLSGMRRKIGMLLSIDRELTSDLVQLAENHIILMDALRSGDPVHAENVFREHIIEVGDRLVARMHELGEYNESGEEVS